MTVAAHAAAAPWEGRNSLDGFVAAYQMTGLLRQQLQGSDRIHHIVKSDTELVPNVIPDYVEAVWGVRGPTRSVSSPTVLSLSSLLF